MAAILPFNADNPTVAGIEWFPVRQVPKPLVLGQAVGVQLASKVTESVTEVDVAATIVGTGIVICDIYEAGDEQNNDTSVYGALVAPHADGASSVGWQQTTDGTTWVAYQNAGSDGYPFINKYVTENMSPTAIAALMAGDLHRLRYLPTGSQTEGHLLWQRQASPTWKNSATGGSGTDPTGDRVGWIEVFVTARLGAGAGVTMDGRLRIGTTIYGSDSGPVHLTGSFALYRFKFWWDPSTGLPWLTGDIAAFITGGGADQFGVSISGIAGTDVRIGAVSLVYKALPETRLATAVGFPDSGGGYEPYTMCAPTTRATAAWAKVAAHDYVIIFSPAQDAGVLTLNGCDQGSLAEFPTGALPGYDGYTTALSGSSMVVAGTPTYTTWALSLILFVTAAISADSNAYISTTERFVLAAGTDGQHVANMGAGTYGVIQAVVQRTNTATDDLTFTFGTGTAVLTPADVPGDGLWHLVSVHLSASQTPGAGAHDITFACPDEDWSVAIANCGTTITLGPNDASVAGYAKPGGVENDHRDYLLNVSTVPASLGSFTGSIGGPLTHTHDAPGGPHGIYYAALNWADSADAAFGYYEVQRGPDGSTWTTIAKITTLADSFFNDFESPRNLPSHYRVRQVRTNSVPSDWSV